MPFLYICRRHSDDCLLLNGIENASGDFDRLYSQLERGVYCHYKSLLYIDCNYKGTALLRHKQLINLIRDLETGLVLIHSPDLLELEYVSFTICHFWFHHALLPAFNWCHVIP